MKELDAKMQRLQSVIDAQAMAQCSSYDLNTLSLQSHEIDALHAQLQHIEVQEASSKRN